MDKLLNKKIVCSANIILPSKHVDPHFYSIVACDQHSNQIDYWNAIKEKVKGKVSLANVIIPEAFYNQKEYRSILESSKIIFANYCKKNYFDTHLDTQIIVERTFLTGEKRVGLVCSIDLNYFSVAIDYESRIKPSEAIIKDKVIKRIEQKEILGVEFSHTLLFFNDTKKIINNAYCKVKSTTPLYDFELLSNGGHIRGWLCCGTILNDINHWLTKDKTSCLIVGDGNHSIVSAKEYYNRHKSHDSRFFLTEINDINDKGIKIYPIHRFIINCDKEKLFEKLVVFLGKTGYELRSDSIVDLSCSINPIETYFSVDSFLDNYAKEFETHIQIEYVHNVSEVDSGDGCLLIMPVIEKKDIIGFVSNSGVLPKKSFSIGKSEEKRFYLEGVNYEHY